MSQADLRRMAASDRSPRLQAHVKGCGHCREELRFLQLLVEGRRLAGPPGTCPDAEALVRLGAGLLDASEASGLQDHLTACAGCAADMEGLAAGGRLAGRLPQPKAPGLITQFAGGLRSLADALRELATFEMPPSLASVTRSAVAIGERAEAGLAAYRKGRFEVARRELEAALAAGDRAPELRFFLAACVRREGDAAAAVELLEKVVRARPRIAEYRWHLAQALLACGRGEEALAQLDKAAALPGSRRESAKDLARRVRALLAG